MADRVFVDTNILLRATLTHMPQHREAAAELARRRAAGDALWISRQVIRELTANVTRPQTFYSPLSAVEVGDSVQVLTLSFQVADETAAVTAQLLALLREYPTGGKQVHDANIVATMLVYGIGTLLTLNLDDMRRFAGRVAIVPLAAAPPAAG